MPLFGLDEPAFIGQQRGRRLASVTREPVQNALDTDSDFSVTVDYDARAIEIVDQDAYGVKDFDNLTDLFKGDKASDPTKRGRYGRGVKEFIAFCDHVEIESTGGRQEIFIGYDDDEAYFSSYKRESDDDRDAGTRIRGHGAHWTENDLAEVEAFLSRLQVPEDQRIDVAVRRGGMTTWRTYTHETPDAVVADDGGLGLTTLVAEGNTQSTRPLKDDEDTSGDRIHVRHAPDEAGIYEMGIPVTEHDFPYVVDIQQKTPLPERRESLPNYYQKELAIAILEHGMDAIDDEHLGHEWFTEALGEFDYRRTLSSEAAQTYIERRFGPMDALVLDHNSPRRAVDKATNFGKTVLNKNDELSNGVFSLVFDHVPLAEAWVQQTLSDASFQEVDPTPEQEAFRRYAQDHILDSLHTGPLNGIRFAEITVEDEDRQPEAMYHNDGYIYLNVLANDWDEVNGRRVGAIVHELAHAKNPGEGHGRPWYETLTNDAGRLHVETAPVADAELRRLMSPAALTAEELADRRVDPSPEQEAVSEDVAETYLPYSTEDVDRVRFADLADVEDRATVVREDRKDILYLDAGVDAGQGAFAYRHDIMGAFAMRGLGEGTTMTVEGYLRMLHDRMDQRLSEVGEDAMKDPAVREELAFLDMDYEQLEERRVEPSDEQERIADRIEEAYLQYAPNHIRDVRFADFSDRGHNVAVGEEEFGKTVLYLDQGLTELDPTDFEFRTDLMGAMTGVLHSSRDDSRVAEYIADLKEAADFMFSHGTMRHPVDDEWPRRLQDQDPSEPTVRDRVSNYLPDWLF